MEPRTTRHNATEIVAKVTIATAQLRANAVASEKSGSAAMMKESAWQIAEFEKLRRTYARHIPALHKLEGWHELDLTHGA